MIKKKQKKQISEKEIFLYVLMVHLSSKIELILKSNRLAYGFLMTIIRVTNN